METLLQDDKFKSSSSPVARETRSAVKCMLEWCKEEKNSGKLNGFAEQVVQELQLCFSQWSMYHTTRISANFNATWHSFLSSALENCRERNLHPPTVPFPSGDTSIPTQDLPAACSPRTTSTCHSPSPIPPSLLSFFPISSFSHQPITAQCSQLSSYIQYVIR